MRRALARRLLLSQLCVVACGGLGGCALATDVINPDFFSALGIDPAALSRSDGVVLMVFNNTTDFDATFFGFETPSRLSPLIDARNFSVAVPADENRNEVLECPLYLVGTGSVSGTGNSLTFDGLAAVVEVDGDVVEVGFGNGILEQGTAFQCGDVIEVRLQQTGPGTLGVTVRVLPGQ